VVGRGGFALVGALAAFRRVGFGTLLMGLASFAGVGGGGIFHDFGWENGK
jgi:hypothetical protein